MTGSRFKFLLSILIYIQLHSMVIISEGRRESIQGIGHRKNPRNGRCHSQSSSSASDELLCGQSSWMPDGYNGPDRPGAFPFDVLIQTPYMKDWSDFCGGVLIDDQHILTAAHCLPQICKSHRARSSYIKPEEIQVTLGYYPHAEDDGAINIMNVSHAIPHEDYRCGGKDDIAMLRLAEPVNFKITANGKGSINQVCLSEDMHEVGEKAMVLGYVKFDNLANIWDWRNLRMASIKHTEDSDCKTEYGNEFDGEKQICFTSSGDYDSPCFISSGEPVVYAGEDGRHHLLGLTMYEGQRICGRKSEFFYTRVSYYLDWIAETKKSIS